MVQERYDPNYIYEITRKDDKKEKKEKKMINSVFPKKKWPGYHIAVFHKEKRFLGDKEGRKHPMVITLLHVNAGYYQSKKHLQNLVYYWDVMESRFNHLSEIKPIAGRRDLVKFYLRKIIGHHDIQFIIDSMRVIIQDTDEDIKKRQISKKKVILKLNNRYQDVRIHLK